MTPRPTTFGQLIQRMVCELPDDAYRCPPIVASAVAMDEPATGEDGRFWVVVHSITDHDVRLLHPKPVHAKSLAVRIEAESGEVVQVVVAATGCRPRGELYETTAQFLPLAHDAGQLV